MKRIFFFIVIITTLCISFLLCGLLIGKQTIHDFQQLVYEKNIKSDLDQYSEVFDSLRKEDYDDEILVINLWASWCKPCINEIPSLSKLTQDYRGQKITFYAINSNFEGKEEEFLEKHKINFAYKRIYSRDLFAQLTKLSFNDKAGIIPQYIIVDKEGKLKEILYGASDENLKRLRTLLDEMIEASHEMQK